MKGRNCISSINVNNTIQLNWDLEDIIIIIIDLCSSYILKRATFLLGCEDSERTTLWIGQESKHMFFGIMENLSTIIYLSMVASGTFFYDQLCVAIHWWERV